jgi:hypothetical protein
MNNHKIASKRHTDQLGDESQLALAIRLGAEPRYLTKIKRAASAAALPEISVFPQQFRLGYNFAVTALQNSCNCDRRI